MREAWKALAGGPQQQLDSILVGNFGAVNLGLEHQAFRIHEQLSFAAADLLAAIVAPLFATGPTRLGRLGINYSCAGLWVSPQPHPQAHTQSGVEPLEGSIYAPSPTAPCSKVAPRGIVGTQCLLGRPARVDNRGRHEQAMPKSKGAWCNVIARRCRHRFFLCNFSPSSHGPQRKFCEYLTLEQGS